MREISARNFGLLIAYLLPGFVALWGVSYFSSTVRSWFGAIPGAAPTVGGFFYVTLGSLAAGVTISGVRWAVIDSLHHLLGVRPPKWDFRRLPRQLDAFELLVESHYRYYQFYANMLVSVSFSYAVVLLVSDLAGAPSRWSAVAFLVLTAVFFGASRDALRKYYARAAHLIGARTSGDH